ncbi:cytochrome P450 [Hypoxylon rubiginosum]|uniref:Cytochrome P450 n=1 Tax=Hypoxylon rubiginosum TaxID=110542 RepID=A0ACB9ZD89_9PEZI|nr:cytochrome P450 [Hypoxylon rubiginosum]
MSYHQILFGAAGVGVVAVVIFSLCRILFNVFSHPLALIPGPTIAAASNLWLIWRTFTLRKCETLHECLAKYGPVVRIAPDKILISSQKDIKTIYGIGTKCLKSEFYPQWGLNGASNIFSTTDPKDHSVRRSITARTFSKKSVMQFMPELVKHAQALAERLESLSKPSGNSYPTVEFVKLARYLALDMLGSSVLSEDFGLLKRGIEHPFVHDLDSAALVIPTRATVHSWLWAILKRLPIPQWQHHLGGERRLAHYAANTVEAAFSEAAQGKTEGLALVSSYANYEAPDGGRLSTERIVGEVAAVYFAGTDTTSITLSLMVYEIACRPDVQRRLRDEIIEKAGSGSSGLRYDTLENECAYLNAVISEGLRLYGAIPSHLERVVPAGGITLSTGHQVPAGSVVGVQAYSLHRDPAVFPNPDAFDPNRWFHATPEMRKSLSPWGFGSRICMGMHLAYVEFRLALAVLFGNFEVSFPASFDHNDMRMRNFWFVFPQGGKLDVVVKPLSAEVRGDFHIEA